MAVKATLFAQTQEDQLLELIARVRALQATAAKNPNNVTFVTAYSINAATSSASISLTIPLTTTIDPANGNLIFSATESYLD